MTSALGYQRTLRSWSIACLPTPCCYTVAASAFHLVNLPADAKATDGLYEMEVVEAQQAE